MFNAIKNITLGIGYGIYLTALAPKSQREAVLAKARAQQITLQAETPQVEEKAEEAITPEPIHVEALEPAATEQPKAEINLNALDSGTLRKLCSQYGIPWRNLRGQGRHLTKAAMVFQLERVATAA
ncbi:hypothetical protein [Coleofasciculus sp. FACHB-129]|uniref:hypothetical protein n=1 Tax=Cyanophyceae TaxID=3028117 RepID=UPI0016855DB8|nr:hypothetical protein [Coleofasciculus sp. FACHB-129]MBD1895903.1 hypothetical protein [Coleofasciculus sp. FACHB-129]